MLNVDGSASSPPFTADNNYNFDSVALPRLCSVIASMPQVVVRSFYVGR